MVGLAAFALAETLYVSPRGNDAAAGTERRPLKTISRALSVAQAKGIRRIVVAGGEYPQSETLRVAQEGLAIEAKPGERPLITGAVMVPASAITVCPDAILQARAKSLDKDAEAFEIDVAKVPGATLSPFTPYGFPRPIIPGPTELFADQEPMRIARWPNDGFTTVASVREPGNGEEDRNQPPRKPIFKAATDRAKGWTHLESAWLYGYWKYDWADETIQIHAIDHETGEITLATPHPYGVDKGAEFFAENVPEELDAVGEYFVDAPNRRVRFVARKGAKATYRLSVLGGPLVSAGSKVTFRDLDFAYSRGDGATVANASGTRFEGCRFFNLGERGAVFQGGEGSGLLGCDVWNTAEGGVVLAGGDRNTLKAARNFVTNCDIHHYQRRSMTYRPAVLISGVGNEVTHCDLHDAPHSAIIFSGNDHLIGNNRFYRTVSRTGDGGVVYTGRDWTVRGTRIESNYFFDNVGMSKWEPAIYFDDQASGLIARDNIIQRCHWGFLIGGGRDNVIEGNLIVDCKLGLHCDARGLGWAARSRPTMEERLAAVPYQSEVWRSKYPELEKILAQDPMSPAGNVIRNNQLVRSGKLMQDTEAPFAKTARYEANAELQDLDPEQLKRRVATLGVRNDQRRPRSAKPRP